MGCRVVKVGSENLKWSLSLKRLLTLLRKSLRCYSEFCWKGPICSWWLYQSATGFDTSEQRSLQGCPPCFSEKTQNSHSCSSLADQRSPFTKDFDQMNETFLHTHQIRPAPPPPTNLLPILGGGDWGSLPWNQESIMRSVSGYGQWMKWMINNLSMAWEQWQKHNKKNQLHHPGKSEGAVH